MRQGQDLYDVTARVLTGMRDVLREATPDVVRGASGIPPRATAAAFGRFLPTDTCRHIEAGFVPTTSIAHGRRR